MMIENVLNALRKNHMDAYYVDTKEEARDLALSHSPYGNMINDIRPRRTTSLR